MLDDKSCKIQKHLAYLVFNWHYSFPKILNLTLFNESGQTYFWFLHWEEIYVVFPADIVVETHGKHSDY